MNSRNRMKRQKSATFANKCVHKYTNDKKYRKGRDHCHYTGEYRGVARSICNLKYSIPKEISMISCNRSNFEYHFILEELAKEFK